MANRQILSGYRDMNLRDAMLCVRIEGAVP
jgi:hypothetical protein